MLKFLKDLVGVAAVTIALILLVQAVERAPHVQGSVQSGGEYLSTTTPTVGDGTLLCTGSAILGSVVVTGPKYNAQFQILDGTTTDVVNGAANRAATTTLVLVDIPKTVTGNATTTGVTYTLDVIARKGLVIGSFGNSLASTTITYRCLQN